MEAHRQTGTTADIEVYAAENVVSEVAEAENQELEAEEEAEE